MSRRCSLSVLLSHPWLVLPFCPSLTRFPEHLGEGITLLYHLEHSNQLFPVLWLVVVLCVNHHPPQLLWRGLRVSAPCKNEYLENSIDAESTQPSISSNFFPRMYDLSNHGFWPGLHYQVWVLACGAYLKYSHKMVVTMTFVPLIHQ